jgi:hypothetical protein
MAAKCEANCPILKLVDGMRMRRIQTGKGVTREPINTIASIARVCGPRLVFCREYLDSATPPSVTEPLFCQTTERAS